MHKKIILTGGGTAGHVTPNIALIPALQNEGFDIAYIGSMTGIEKDLISACGIRYYSISTGKLRRYLSTKNITDMFRVLAGLGEARKIIKKEKPDLIFSKGGFVGVPVVMAGKSEGVPIVVHESDITPGLANKISYPFAKNICVSFPETLPLLPKRKGVLTGAPIRESILHGNRIEGLRFCGFDGKKPVLMVTGGSLGSVKINECIYKALPSLIKKFDVVHLCGKNHINTEIISETNSVSSNNYKQFEYVNEQLPDLLACSDIIVSRAGANSINEFLVLKKPNVLIPLSKKASRGDQILNAESFKKQNFSGVIPEEELSPEKLTKHAFEVYKNREMYINAMVKSPLNNGINEVLNVILKILNKS